MAGNVTKAVPIMTNVMFENERVRVVEPNMKKGGKVSGHARGTFFTYPVAPFDYKSTPGGKAGKRKMKARKVDWSDGETHANEAFTTDGRALAFEHK